MTKKAEDFSILVSIAAKNLCSYISFIQFLTCPELYESLWKINEVDLGKMQLKIFEDRGEGSFEI